MQTHLSRISWLFCAFSQSTVTSLHFQSDPASTFFNPEQSVLQCALSVELVNDQDSLCQEVIKTLHLPCFFSYLQPQWNSCPYHSAFIFICTQHLWNRVLFVSLALCAFICYFPNLIIYMDAQSIFVDLRLHNIIWWAIFYWQSCSSSSSQNPLSVTATRASFPLSFPHLDVVQTIIGFLTCIVGICRGV